MINYPNKKKPLTEKQYKTQILPSKKTNTANRGMDLEHDLNISNEYYVNNGIALIYKRPTPINIVKVDYSKGAKIIDAYFEKQSTTDYNGVYKGRYLDFEAKSTHNLSSFPLHNIYSHQIDHLKKVNECGGIAFFIIEFVNLNEVFFLDSKFVIDFYQNSKRKSIPYQTIKEKGILIERKFKPRLDYLKAVEQFYDL